MANTDPFRLAIMKRLTTLLQSIGPGTGYATDMSTRVFRGRSVYGENDPLPMVAIIEPPVPVDQLPSPVGADASSGNWDILIQGFLADDPKNPTDPAHILVAQVRSVLVKERASRSNPDVGMLGTGARASRVDDIFIGAPVVRPPDEISAKAYFWLPVTLVIQEDLDDPLNYK